MASRIDRIKGRLEQYYSSDVLSFRQLLTIVLPILWEQIFFTAMSLLSTWLMSLDGENALSVVNMMTVVGQVFLSIAGGLVTGGTVLVAQNIGAKRTDMAARTLVQTMGFAFVFTAVLGAGLALFRGRVVGYLLEGAGGEIISLAVTYFTGFCISFPLYALYQGFAGAMRGWGRTGTALRLTLAVNCAELALTALFVIGLRMGVPGITLALVCSRALGAAVAGFLLLRMRRELGLRAAYLQPNPRILRGIAAIAVPLALEQFFFNSGKAFSQRFIAGYGTAHMAAGGVVNAVFNLLNIPQSTLTAATVTVVGMCIGGGRPDLGRAYVLKFLRTIRCALLGLMPLTVPLAAALVYRYRLSDTAQALSFVCLGIIFLMNPLFLGGSFTTPAGLRAGGDAVYTSAVALGAMWLVRVVCSWLFTSVLPWGVVGLNLAMVIEWALRTALYRLRLNTGAWYRHELTRER